jgi:cobalt-zinc-cadmium efflux system outer membrane protein
MVRVHRKYAPAFLSAAFTFALLAPGCASLGARHDMDRSAAAVEAAVGVSSEYLKLDEEAARSKTAELMAGGLAADEAVQVALLNNPRVRAAMLSIGVSRADFVQATLFTNPTLTLSLRLPDSGGLANFETALTQNIAELWLIPARKRVAQHELERTVLDAARIAASIALEARSAYVRALRASGQQKVAQDQLAITERLVEVAGLRQKAGSGSEIDVNLAATQRLEAQTALRNAELAATEARSDLARLLGLSTRPESISLADQLPEPATWKTSADALQQTAREYRLDLQIADQSVAAAEARVREEHVRFLKSLEVGLAMERGERRSRGDRNWGAETFYDSLQAGQLTPPNLMPRSSEGEDVIIGPTFGMELPLWDQNQAQIAKAQRLLQQSVQLRDALLIDAAQDIHTRLARVRTAAENARFYRDEQLPAAERSAQLSRDAYRSGRLSFLSVLESERSLLTARSGYLAALESAALATVDLERVTGRPAATLAAPELSPATATQPSSPPAVDQVQP